LPSSGIEKPRSDAIPSFCAEFFDIFNQLNFGTRTSNIQSGIFGEITSTRLPHGDQGSSRQLQMPLKLLF
jgi:hypothetical protein